MINSLEGVVIKWTCQIDEILKQDSSTLFNGKKEPVPSDEINFWQNRLKNLENIFSQLRDFRVKQVGNILETIESVYCKSFKKTFKNVVNALDEARNITLWLKPLKKYFDDFDTKEFLELKDKIHPLLHCICLVWAHSPYYATNSRMVVLFKTMNNMIINCASRSLDPESLFQSDPYEALVRLEQNIDLLNFWRFQFFAYKEKLKEFQLPNTTPIFWSFLPKDIFQRFDLFIKRLTDVREILVTAVEFMKLERIEVGGLKGRIISRQIKNIFEEFRDKTYREWADIQFNLLDPDSKNQKFKIQKKAFHEKSYILEMRLAIQFRYAFEDCANLDQLIKLVLIGGSLFSRPIIVKQVGKKLLSLLHLFNDDLELIKNCFDKAVEGYKSQGFKSIPKDDCFPDLSGTIIWLHKLRSRLEKPSNDMELLEFSIFENEEGRYIIEKKQKILDLLNKFEAEIFDQWNNTVSNLITSDLSQNLLVRNEKLLNMNFKSSLQDVLNEVQHLMAMGKDNISSIAFDLFERSTEIWDLRMKLMRIVEWYNNVKTKTNQQELNILQQEIFDIDTFLEVLILKFTWSNYDIEYVHIIYDRLQSLYQRLMKCQKNIHDILEKIKSFGQRPLYERRDGKPDTLIMLDDAEARLAERAVNCGETQMLIDVVMDENFKLLFNTEKSIVSPIGEAFEKIEGDETKKKVNEPEKMKLERGSQVGISSLETDKTKLQQLLYNDYADYVDKVVGEEIIESIRTSIKYIKFEMENKSKRNSPIFETHLSLQNYECLSFEPAVSPLIRGNLSEIVNSIIEHIYKMAEQIKRIYTVQGGYRPESSTYFDYLVHESSICQLAQDIINHVKITCRDVIDYYKSYEKKYDFLWLDDKKLFMERFLIYGRALNPSEIETIDTTNCKIQPEREITLNMFKNQIDYFYKVYDDVQRIEKSHLFNGWLTVNMKEFIAGLSNVAMRWCAIFITHLKSKVVEKLNVSYVLFFC